MGVAAARFLKPDPSAPAIDVRVVIPARNEVDNVAACVEAVRGQATEVVVVDDGSSDGTGERAAAAGVTTVIRLDGDPPAGWTGKPRACLAGANGAATTWLAFVDADVVLHPSALATMAAATRHTSTSIVGGLDCRSFWERLLLPELGFALVQAGLPPDFASGHCFLVRRDHYEAVGGHGHPEVRGSVIDDRDLARVLTGHEPRIAPDLLRARMYRNGRELRAGLVKNQAGLHAAGGGGRSAYHLAALLAPVATRRPWAVVVASAGGRLVARQNPAYGVLAPIARVVLAGIHLESWWCSRTRRPVSWKGRAITPPLRRPDAAPGPPPRRPASR